MPWFYFVPFKLKSDLERKSTTPVVDFKMGNVLLYIAIGTILVAMFFAFTVIPAVIAMREAIPAQ